MLPHSGFQPEKQVGNPRTSCFFTKAFKLASLCLTEWELWLALSSHTSSSYVANLKSFFLCATVKIFSHQIVGKMCYVLWSVFEFHDAILKVVCCIHSHSLAMCLMCTRPKYFFCRFYCILARKLRISKTRLLLAISLWTTWQGVMHFLLSGLMFMSHTRVCPQLLINI